MKNSIIKPFVFILMLSFSAYSFAQNLIEISLDGVEAQYVHIGYCAAYDSRIGEMVILQDVHLESNSKEGGEDIFRLYEMALKLFNPNYSGIGCFYLSTIKKA